MTIEHELPFLIKDKLFISQYNYSKVSAQSSFRKNENTVGVWHIKSKNK
jgi:hypothetical protein